DCVEPQQGALQHIDKEAGEPGSEQSHPVRQRNNPIHHHQYDPFRPPQFQPVGQRHDAQHAGQQDGQQDEPETTRTGVFGRHQSSPPVSSFTTVPSSPAIPGAAASGTSGPSRSVANAGTASSSSSLPSSVATSVYTGSAALV